MRKSAVVGLMFDSYKEEILLLQKAKPVYMAGLWNGPGGRIEEGELPIDAMVREWEEETGVKTDPSIWERFAVINIPRIELHYFRTFQPWKILQEARTMPQKNADGTLKHADETIRRFPLGQLPPTAAHLNWLIPMALGMRPDIPHYEITFEVKE